MKLNFDSVKFRNFLSFGSKWEELIFQEGVNVILGKNGSGKSSCMETIPFALFGKTHKDIKKSELINWKNRKQLEVQLSFSKGDDKYKVLRAIKPDNFEIYKNDTLYEKLSHVRDYQTLLEDIIGTNFQTFMSLIHSNINASKPILSMSKPDKRKFIEKVFGLSIYSKLIDKCNKKIASIDNKVRDTELIVSHNEMSIRDSNISISNFNNKLSNLGSSTIELNEVNEELVNREFTILLEDEYSKLKESIDTIAIELDDTEYKSSKFKTKKAVIGTKVKDLLKRIPDKVKSVSEGDYQEEYDTNDKEIKLYQLTLQTLDKMKASYTGELSGLKKRQKLLNTGKCPTCGQDVQENLITELGDDITALEDNIKNTELEYIAKDETLSSLISDGMELSDKIEQLKTYKDSEVKRKLLTYDKNKWKKVFIKLSSYDKKLEDKRIKLSNKSSVLVEEYNDENVKRKDIKELERKALTLKEKILLEEDTKKEFQSIITTEVEKVKKWKQENMRVNLNTGKLNDIKDYMSHIKFICRDDQIKAYSISSMVPTLMKYTNKYLGEIGHPFFIHIDTFLNPTIKGPGISSGSYENLSSGESKSVDLSLQNAFLDIARIQAGIYPDISILDEILDSSIDSSSLATLLQMVTNKQIEDKSKVYIISHREEVGDLDAVNTLLLEKIGGYSKISHV